MDWSIVTILSEVSTLYSDGSKSILGTLYLEHHLCLLELPWVSHPISETHQVLTLPVSVLITDPIACYEEQLVLQKISNLHWLN